jgi:hypothetical protein
MKTIIMQMLKYHTQPTEKQGKQLKFYLNELKRKG